MEVITGDVGRRTWSPEEKARILAEAAVPGVVVSEVARRHGLRPQQVFGWRRDVNRLEIGTLDRRGKGTPLSW
ncbi:transposase [Azospirillum thiophilum]